MVNLSDELSELSYDELQYLLWPTILRSNLEIYLLWAYNIMKQLGDLPAMGLQCYEAARRSQLL